MAAATLAADMLLRRIMSSGSMELWFMDEMRRVAQETVMRACAFGSLAIFCFMVGLSFMPRLAFQVGGMFTMVMTGVLLVKAWEARTRPYRRTELWLYLPEECRPPVGVAQQVTSVVMRETYMTFASWTAGVAVAMWGAALMFSLMGY